MRVRLLGPIDVIVGGEPRPMPGTRRRTVLAALALHPGTVVSTDRLIQLAWEDEAGAISPNTLQSQISRLRAAMGDRDTIRAQPPGYVLSGADITDVLVAERLVRDAMATTEGARRVRLLREAVRMWRGRPLDDVADVWWTREHRERLDRLLVRAKLELNDALLATGEHDTVVAEARQLAAVHPFDERMHRQLMLALYRAGRQADALDAAHQLRRRLRDELGIDPSCEVRELEAAILNQSPALSAVEPSAVKASEPATVQLGVPAQLPLAVRAFVGRDAELARLDDLLPAGADAAGDRPSTVVISAVSGTAGVGKTTLAVHWAHRIRHRFPDGNLYVNLRGFDPDAAPTEPAEVVRGFLSAFGVPARQVPADVAAQAALYRSIVADRRVLIVLDNARDVSQVRPLLPGAGASLVIVTSRNHLTALVATEGAHPLPLDLLTPDESRQLLTGRLGSQRIASEPDAIDDIIARCARLPLALAIFAARAAIRPRFPLARLAADLREAEAGLDALSGGDARTDVRAAFSWSYQALSPEAARLFRMLGSHPGVDFSMTAAASLAGVEQARTRVLLDELTQAQMITEAAPGRYIFHDLLRAYATEQHATHDSDAERDAAIRRTLDHYLQSAHMAVGLLSPYRPSIAIEAPLPGVGPDRPEDPPATLRWFGAEHRVISAVIRRAADLGFDFAVWRLAFFFTPYLERQGHWHEWLDLQEVAHRSTRNCGDMTGLGHTVRSLAGVHTQLGHYELAYDHFQHASSLFTTLGDDIGQAQTQLNLSWLAELRERPGEAIDHAQRALALYRSADSAVGQARALFYLGTNHLLLGDHKRALDFCGRALALSLDSDDLDGQAWALDGLGQVYQACGEHIVAVDYYRESLHLIRHHSDRYAEAETLIRLGDCHDVCGDAAAAAAAWRAGLEILESIGHRDIDRVRARLDSTSR